MEWEAFCEEPSALGTGSVASGIGILWEEESWTSPNGVYKLLFGLISAVKLVQIYSLEWEPENRDIWDRFLKLLVRLLLIVSLVESKFNLAAFWEVVLNLNVKVTYSWFVIQKRKHKEENTLHRCLCFSEFSSIWSDRVCHLILSWNLVSFVLLVYKWKQMWLI